MSGRPLDVLEAAVGKRVTVLLKGGETHRGTLAGYDQHMNLVLDPVGDAGGDDAGAADSVDSGDPADPVETGAVGVEAVGDTTIIRGDNVVSITP